MILSDTFARNNGLCAQCIKNPAYAQIKADYSRAKSEGRDLRDETNDTSVLYCILRHEIETGQYEKVGENSDTHGMPDGYVSPPMHQRLLKHKAITIGESFGCCDLEWIEPAPLIKVELIGIDHAELRESIIQNLEGFEAYVAFGWKGSGEYYCWDTARITSEGEYMICIAGSGASDDYAPNMQLLLLREVIENSYGEDADDQAEMSETIQTLSSCIPEEVVHLMKDLNARLRDLDYDYGEYKDLMIRYIGQPYS